MTDRHQPARSVDDEVRAGADAIPRSPGAEGLLSIDRDIRETIEVLVVDDEHTLRESCASILRADGFPVTVCARGEDAMELLQRRRFDIILLDLYLPKMSGMDVLEVALKESPGTIVWS
jgi:response regulator RpfG family c-di-GMP phosphodiesterase